MFEVDKHLIQHLKTLIEKIETEFNADAIFYYGEIHPAHEKLFRDAIEELKVKSTFNAKPARIAIILNTPGGSAETVEKMVDIIRYHYQDVSFIVPDYAMSAGTILCMSGDRIYMDYSSSLGPIDPQVLIRGSKSEVYVPALGYLDKVNEMLRKSANGTLTDAELLILQGQDLGMLRSYEQARDLTVSLLKEWLVKYKFATWTVHRTDPKKKGKQVTLAEKQKRADEIAQKLGNNQLWHSHGRNIDINKLKALRLDIEDYSANTNLRTVIRNYNDVLTDYLAKVGTDIFIHSKHLNV